MEQRELQKTKTWKEASQAEDRHEVVKNELMKASQSLEEVKIQTSELTRKKERLETEFAREQLKQERFLVHVNSMTSEQLVSEVIANIQFSIFDLKDDIAVLESEIKQQGTKEETLKQELAVKEKEADDNKKALDELKNQQLLFRSTLDVKRKLFEEDIQWAEDQQQELDGELQEISESLQQVIERSAALVKEKERLEQKMARKQSQQKRLETQRSSMTDKEVASEMIADIQGSVDDYRERIALLDVKISEQKVKEEHLKKQIVVKEKEVNDNRQTVEKLKEKHSILCSTLEAERKVLDCQLRQKNQSSETRPAEIKVGAPSLSVATDYKKCLCYNCFILIIELQK